jgi:sarcosine oxidase subunit alpha
MTGSRLASGGRIDRRRPLNFTFDGRAWRGFAGDTLASALLANGVEVVGRSFKAHRPRGLQAAGVEEPNALIQLGEGASSEPNPPATTIELEDGLVARAVNAWPNARLDLMAINGLFGRFIPAGFYYKTFLWPSWRAYEWAIRRAAGLGRISGEPDPDAYDARFAHCDVLVVGAGPAGLAAARAAAAGGARVMLVEQDTELGGSLLADPGEIDGSTSDAWIDAVRAELASCPECEVLTRTTAIGYFDHNALALVQRAPLGASAGAPRLTLWSVRARRVVLAAGAFERPLVFSGNDRPGVMLASAVRSYLNRHGVLAGRRSLVFTNNDGAYATAAALAKVGGEVAAIVDVRREPPAALAQLAADLRIPLIAGGCVTAAHGAPGLRRVTVRDGAGRSLVFEADLLAMSGGWNPTIHLSSQSGAKPRWAAERACFLPGPPVQAEESVGAAAGLFSLAQALASGHAAGIRVAETAGFVGAVAAARDTGRPHPFEAGGIEPAWDLSARGKALVDFQNDVTVDDIALSARENFVSIEHLKRYTTLGMGVDQGKTSNVNALAIMAGLTGVDIPAVGVTRFRPPFVSTAISAFAGLERGALFKPLRRLPAHDRHAALGAVFEEYGGWLRPAHYLRPGESALGAEQREALAVRARVGLFDASPLGKIEVAGPDAAIFLDRIYANLMSTLKVGRGRYGLMLNELGVIIDDGVCLRLADDRFLVGTTSAGAARIAAHLEEWLQCEWTGLDVLVAPVTAACAVPTLSGPRARDVLRAAGTSLDLAPEAFPHMTFREGEVAGVPARVARVSFTGETSFEISVPAGAAPGLIDRLTDVGQAFGLEPVGIDAWMLLRTEKGFLHVGADTDGTTLPADVGFGHVLRRKGDFIGRRSLTQTAALAPGRPQLVGLRLDATADRAVPPVGAHLRSLAASAGSEGYVTSAGFSPTLGRPVALAMVDAGRSRLGETVRLLTAGRETKAVIAAPGAYDPGGERLHA